MTTAVLVVGYVLAVPFTIWVPGFLRLWRRRELTVYVLAQAGAALIILGSALNGSLLGVIINGLWLLGLALAYAREGRKRARSTASSTRLSTPVR